MVSPVAKKMFTSQKMRGIPHVVGFLKKHRCFQQPGTKGLTHVCMNGTFGGRVIVPDSLLSDFHDAYSKDLEDNNFCKRLTFVEYQTDIFPAFFDMDILIQGERGDDQGLIKMIEILQDTVRLFFPDVHSKQENGPVCIVCRAPMKKMENGMKMGVHIVLPHVYVGVHEIMLIRQMFLAKLNISNPIQVSVPWEQIVDRQVYQGSGMRMVGSMKVTVCTKCTRETTKNCEFCNENRKVMEDRPYTLWKVFKNVVDDALTFQMRPASRLVNFTSIRCNKKEVVGFVRPDGCPSYSMKLAERKEKRREWSKFKVEVKNHQIRNLIQAIVRERISPNYSQIIVKSILADERNDSYTIDPDERSIGASFCMNKNGDHSNHKIFFVINSVGVSQRCKCKCDKPRLHGLCKDFKPEPRCIVKEVVNQLFPIKNKKAALTYSSTNNSQTSSETQKDDKHGLLIEDEDVCIQAQKMAYMEEDEDEE